MRFTYDPLILVIISPISGSMRKALVNKENLPYLLAEKGKQKWTGSFQSNKSLHLTAIPLRSIAAGEFNRYTFREAIC